jgi:hypothetical protein
VPWRHTRTLQRLTEKVVINPGINAIVFNIMKLKAKHFSSEALECVICADEMSIKSNLYYDIGADEIIGFHQVGDKKEFLPANNVLAIMARGIFENWKQPIAYVYVNTTCNSNELKKLIFDAVGELRKINFKARAFISDVGSNFVKFSNILNISPEHPFFYADSDLLDENKFFYIFDPCHLLKALRNNFLKYIFLLENGEAIDRSYLIQFCERDFKRSLRFAPKLTRTHICPGPFDKLKVQLAAQLFSHSVAAGMEAEMALNILPQSAKATIEFISNINNLFDILNSTGHIVNEMSYKAIFSGTGKQMELIENMLHFFDLVTVHASGADVTKRIKSLWCWKITINSLISIHNFLKKPLITRRFNQDIIENFFGAIRKQSGNCYNPTPIQFKSL